jgi:chemotaxis protein CheD
MNNAEQLTQVVVAVSDAKVSGDAGELLVTYALGSCIGVCLHDGAVGLAGMLHYQLPSSAMSPDRAREQPMMFADTGLAKLLLDMERQGGLGSRMTVKLAGGAQMLNDAKLFSIGRRNYTAIRKVLWDRGMLIHREDVGGDAPRTVYLRVADGAVMVKANGNTYPL